MYKQSVFTQTSVVNPFLLPSLRIHASFASACVSLRVSCERGAPSVSRPLVMPSGHPGTSCAPGGPRVPGSPWHRPFGWLSSQTCALTLFSVLIGAVSWLICRSSLVFMKMTLFSFVLQVFFGLCYLDQLFIYLFFFNRVKLRILFGQI